MTVTEESIEKALFITFYGNPFYKFERRPWTHRAWNDVPVDVKEALDFLVQRYVVVRGENKNEVWFYVGAPIEWKLSMAKHKWVF